ncbi:MAG: hypothetical protein Q7V57_00610 [Actinomycetota bacterium]|nr:hypothetical protein [Actinomycetota bacterium]
MTIDQGSYHQREAVIAPATTPLPPLPTAAAPAVVPAPAPAPAPAPVVSRVRRSSGSHFEPDALFAAGVGLVLTVLGLIVMIRGGFDGTMSAPVVEVLGFTHTTTLGIIEVILGIALLASGASRSRSSEIFFGTVLGVVGFVGAVQNESFTKNLALESSMAWIIAIVGAAVVAATLMLPRFSSRSTTTTQQ